MNSSSEDIGGIYIITNKVDGKFYLGSTLSFNRRFAEHKNSLDKGKHHSIHLQRAWNKYGVDSFEFKQLFVCGKNELAFCEQQYLDQLQPYDYRIGYNMNNKVDSRLGRKMSLEARRKMSITKKGKPSPRKGMKVTEETRKRMSESHKGYKQSVEQRRKTSERMKGNQYGKGIPYTNKTNKKIIPWNKGKTDVFSEETKEKMRISAKNRLPNRKGTTHSKESREKMSVAVKRYWEIKKQESYAVSK